MKKLILTLLFLCFFSQTIYAFSPDEKLSDPALETRARALTHQIRCPVCQGEALDESNADLAKDLRRLVRERLKAGDSDTEVLQFLQQRYGDYILMQPPITAQTFLLWALPFFILISGGFVFYRFSRQRKGNRS